MIHSAKLSDACSRARLSHLPLQPCGRAGPRPSTSISGPACRCRRSWPRWTHRPGCGSDRHADGSARCSPPPHGRRSCHRSRQPGMDGGRCARNCARRGLGLRCLVAEGGGASFDGGETRSPNRGQPAHHMVISATTASRLATRSAGASRISSPRRPPERCASGCSSIVASTRTGSGRLVPKAEMPPTT